MPFQTRTAPPSASVTAPSMAELNMIFKTLQTMVPEFPKLEIGELETRPRRLQQWLLNVTQALEPAGHHVMSWWQWVRKSAESTHCIFLTKPLDQREKIIPTEPIPAIWHKWNLGCDLAFWHVCRKSYENGLIYEQQRERLSPRTYCSTTCFNLLLWEARMRRMAYCAKFSIQTCAHNLNLPSWNLCAGAQMCYD